MARSDLLAVVGAIHTAGLDDAQWPRALAAMREIVGGVGATFEVIDKNRFAPTAFHSVGIPPVRQIEYADYYLAINPRVRAGLLTPAGHVHWDYQIIDEAAIRRDPFYACFLPQIGLRYFVAGTIRQTEDEFAVFAIQRSTKQGHVGGREIALMRRLVPHMQQAFDVARRLKSAGEARDVLESTLDCLADGVALLRADGTVIYANESFRAIARRNDGIRIRKNAIEFADSEARTRFKAAIAAVLRLRAGEADSAAGTDFMAARSAGGLSYLVSVRPLLGGAIRKATLDGGCHRFCPRSARPQHCGDRYAARLVSAYGGGGPTRASPAVRHCALGLCQQPGAEPEYGVHPPAPIAGKDRQQPNGRTHLQAQRAAAAAAGLMSLSARWRPLSGHRGGRRSAELGQRSLAPCGRLLLTDEPKLICNRCASNLCLRRCKCPSNTALQSYRRDRAGNTPLRRRRTAQAWRTAPPFARECSAAIRRPNRQQMPD